MIALVIVLLFAAFCVVAVVHDHNKGISQAQAVARRAQTTGIVCPHCHVAGRTITRPTKVKQGILGATATGSSRIDTTTKMSCANCGAAWTEHTN
jgi:hypothetical protein